MTLKSDLENEVSTIFRTAWTERDGSVVPTDESISFKNEAVKMKATVLYADLADSTKMVDNLTNYRSAEIYKTFLHCAAKIIRSENGFITAYDGDRIMAVYIGGSKNTSAVRSALKIKWAVDEIITPKQKEFYPKTAYETKHVIGIDSSDLYVAKTGIIKYNDLVWVGRSANYAAKLSSLPSAYAYITKEVYDHMHNDVKNSNSVSMWEKVLWNTFDNREIYRSSWRWAVS